MEQWVLLRKGADFEGIGKRFQISPRLACLIRNRDVIGDEAIAQYLNGTIADLYDGMLMKDMDKAVDILREKIAEQKRIRVIGDYDIDGVNATYILLEGLEKLGAEADSDIPSRMKDGYGLNIELIERAYQDGIDTIITCDNGIAAAEEIACGKRLGMTIVVTDHHEVPFEEEEDGKKYLLPPADAVIDPKQPGCEYPFKGLCGAAIAYKLVEALWEATGGDAEDLDYLIENVAIATVGDVMELENENRIFVKEGLQMLKRTHSPGLRSLIACTGVDKDRIGAYHIGFVLGPCMNASGRLDTAKRTLNLLRAKSGKEADILAGDLKALNDSRKEMTDIAVEQARQIVDTTKAGKDRVLVLYLPGCHESLAGIVAGRIRERYGKPTFVVTNAEAEDEAKGSGRSIEAYSMFEEMVKCQDLFRKFGGHPMAAGFSLPRSRIDEMRRRLNENCTMTEEDMAEKIMVDVPMPINYIRESLVEELSVLEPFGNGNEKPLFAERHLKLLSARILGKNANVLKLQVANATGCTMEALYFGIPDNILSYLTDKYGKNEVQKLLWGKVNQIEMDLTYYPSINEYQGRRTLQIVIKNFR